MKNKFTAFRRLRDNVSHKPLRQIKKQRPELDVQSIEYDRTLFPINLPPEYHEERLDFIEVPPILRDKLHRKTFSCLGELQGLEPKDFFSWKGFGINCFSVLCNFLSELRQKGPTKLPISTLERIDKRDLPTDVLEFPLSKLNLSKILKTRFHYQFGVATIANIFDTLEHGTLSTGGVGLRTLEHLGNEIATLVKVGSQRYLADYSLEQQSFLKLIEIAKQKMDWREKLIFDTRFLPIDNNVLMLEEIARNVDLTKERVRQIEKQLVKRFQHGTFRELGWIIHRRAIDIFKSAEDELSFESFLSDNFFAGTIPSEAKLPSPINFLNKVYYATFNIGKTRISLRNYAKWRNFT